MRIWEGFREKVTFEMQVMCVPSWPLLSRSLRASMFSFLVCKVDTENPLSLEGWLNQDQGILSHVSEESYLQKDC